MANVWIEVVDNPIDGHQKGEIFEIDEHYAKRFEDQKKAQIVDPPEKAEATEPVVDKSSAKATAKAEATEPVVDKSSAKATAKGL